MSALFKKQEFNSPEEKLEYTKDDWFNFLDDTFGGISSGFMHKKLIGTSKKDVFPEERKIKITLIDDKEPIDTPIEHHLYIQVDDSITFTFQNVSNGMIEESKYSYPVTLPKMKAANFMKRAYADFSDNFAESQKARLKSYR